MNNGTVLFISLGLIMLSGLLIQYLLWRLRIKDKNTLDQHWNKFLHAAAKNNIGEIKDYGSK